MELRKLIAQPNRRIREILREQEEIGRVPDETRDNAKWLELQDEFDEIMLTAINPAWVKWGVKQIEGLSVDGKSLGLDDLLDWPSVFFDEVLTTVKLEAELNGAQRKNSLSRTTSGEPVDLSPNPSTASPAKEEAGGATETASSTSLAE